MLHWHSHIAPLLLPLWLALYGFGIYLAIHVSRKPGNKSRPRRRHR